MKSVTIKVLALYATYFNSNARSAERLLNKMFETKE